MARTPSANPFIGRSLSMVDGRARVTGAIPYSLNLSRPGMLYGRILRSPLPHARIVSVDASRAARLPGIRAVLTRDDLDEDRYSIHLGQVIADQNPVAIDKVRFVGDPVAAVAAIDSDLAAEALELIHVEYEELPAVFDPEAALAPGAPLVHDGPRRVVANRPEVKARSTAGTNIVHVFTQRRGDINDGLRKADRIFERTYESPIASHVALEPHNTIVDVTGEGITVWTCVQNPHAVQAQLAALFRLPLSRVRVVVMTVGGGFGGKLMARLEPVAALLSAKARRPVQLVLSRAEEFLVTSQHAARVRLTTGVMRDGTLVAQRSECFYNAGPYADTTPNLDLSRLRRHRSVSRPDCLSRLVRGIHERHSRERLPWVWDHPGRLGPRVPDG